MTEQIADLLTKIGLVGVLIEEHCCNRSMRRKEIHRIVKTSIVANQILTAKTPELRVELITNFEIKCFEAIDHKNLKLGEDKFYSLCFFLFNHIHNAS